MFHSRMLANQIADVTDLKVKDKRNYYRCGYAMGYIYIYIYIYVCSIPLLHSLLSLKRIKQNTVTVHHIVVETEIAAVEM